ncbi:MAG: Resolvase [Candidatus Moranbacteria bacterium GW2011_GWF2_35_39]|nr:MAG: Resolvase [Candidatus Moranbacteria bacterium GW2011_GWF2_35_39]
MKAIILARVSTEEQKEAGNSLPAQLVRLKNYCKQKEFPVVEIFSFDESAYKTKRDEFDKILNYLKSHPKEKFAVCFDKVDRFSRNVFDKRVATLYELAMEDKIELHFVSDNLVITPNISAAEKFHFGINLGLAKYYSDAISDNVKRAYEQKLRNGEWIGKSYLGYKNITLSDNKKDIVPDKERDFLIKKTFELYASGKYSMKKLMKEMNARGLTNRPSGVPIVTSQIETILKNPFYYGVMRVKGKLYPHKYEPLISKYLFDKVQSVIEGYNKQNFKRTNNPYIFRGMIKCKECGCLITPEIKKGKYIYYHCTNYSGNCENVTWIREEDLIEQTASSLKGLKLIPEALEVLKRDLRVIHDAEQSYCEKNIATLERKLKRIRDSYRIAYEDRLDGRITTDIFDKMMNEWKVKEQDLLLQIDDHSKANQNFFVTSSKILDISQKAYELFISSEPEEKTQLLNFIHQNFFLEGKKLLFEAKIPFTGILEYAKTGNRLRDQDSNLEPID